MTRHFPSFSRMNSARIEDCPDFPLNRSLHSAILRNGRWRYCGMERSKNAESIPAKCGRESARTRRGIRKNAEAIAVITNNNYKQQLQINREKRVMSKQHLLLLCRRR